ncbi:MAG TPA: hypothetical protein VLM88_07705 [Proteiniclasticum sp.]|nr:hypothetical protein [Proteiniclasticum sp.]
MIRGRLLKLFKELDIRSAKFTAYRAIPLTLDLSTLAEKNRKAAKRIPKIR